MIWLMKLCFLAEVALVIQQRDVYASNITWEPTKIPLVFGKDVGIRCTYHNTLSCNDPITWTWYIGTDNDLILTNGTLTDKFKSEHKYSEITSNCLQISTLIVSNFNERDYNQTYKCGIANHKQSGHLFAENIKNKITFENTSYEYIPSDDMISTEIKLKNQQISCRVEIPKVYPLPDFKATFEDTDITNGLKIQKKKASLFYYVSINLTLQNKSVASVGNICIKCKRRGSWWYLTNSWNPRCTDKPTIDESDNSLDVCINVYSISYLVSSMVAILALFFSCKDKFGIIIQILFIIDCIHVVLGTGIFIGYVVARAINQEGKVHPQAMQDFIFFIFQHIGGVKFITIAVVAIIAIKTFKKTKKIKVNGYVTLSSMSSMLSTTVFVLTLLVLKEQWKRSTLMDLVTCQIFLPIRLNCTFLLMIFTDDQVMDNIREKYALLLDSGNDDVYDGVSFKSSGEKTPLMDTKLNLKYFESSGTDVLLEDKENDGQSVENSETRALLMDEKQDTEFFGSSETHAPLIVKEYDVISDGSSDKYAFPVDSGHDDGSFRSTETHVPLVDKAYHVESFGSSDSYNTADERNEEMFTAETVF